MGVVRVKDGAGDCDTDGAAGCDTDGAAGCDTDGAVGCDTDGAAGCDTGGADIFAVLEATSPTGVATTVDSGVTVFFLSVSATS